MHGLRVQRLRAIKDSGFRGFFVVMCLQIQDLGSQEVKS